MYWNYFKYIIEHKFNVFIECMKMGMFIHAFTHDLSKFRPSEFFPYARYFYAEKRIKEYNNYTGIQQDFEKAWMLHQKRNKHHWNYWISISGKNKINSVPMPGKYVKQMIADWKGMSKKFGDTATSFYLKNKDKMILHNITVLRIENELGFTK